jgi:hypothetical protein
VSYCSCWSVSCFTFLTIDVTFYDQHFWIHSSCSSTDQFPMCLIQVDNHFFVFIFIFYFDVACSFDKVNPWYSWFSVTSVFQVPAFGFFYFILSIYFICSPEHAPSPPLGVGTLCQPSGPPMKICHPFSRGTWLQNGENAANHYIYIMFYWPFPTPVG